LVPTTGFAATAGVAPAAGFAPVSGFAPAFAPAAAVVAAGLGTVDATPTSDGRGVAAFAARLSDRL
jgi:hypothetical protein